jgi:hypothetical protein
MRELRRRAIRNLLIPQRRPIGSRAVELFRWRGFYDRKRQKAKAKGKMAIVSAVERILLND